MSSFYRFKDAERFGQRKEKVEDLKKELNGLFVESNMRHSLLKAGF